MRRVPAQPPSRWCRPCTRAEFEISERADHLVHSRYQRNIDTRAHQRPNRRTDYERRTYDDQ